MFPDDILVVDIVFILFDEFANKFPNLTCRGGVHFVANIEKLISLYPVDANN